MQSRMGTLTLCIGISWVLTASGAAPVQSKRAVAAAHGLQSRMVAAWGMASAKAQATAHALPQNVYPTVTAHNGPAWNTSDALAWTAGFWPGVLWQLQQRAAQEGAHEQAAVWASQAGRWMPALQQVAASPGLETDHGFHCMPSLLPAYQHCMQQAALAAAGKPARGAASKAPAAAACAGLEGRLVASARILAERWSPRVGALQSWSFRARYTHTRRPYFLVIIDSLMNLELLVWAAARQEAGGQPGWRDLAVAHALRVAAEHVRADGSTFHLVDYDPASGAVQGRYTQQGLAANSTWARGQAWAVAGFARMWRQTGRQEFLAAARKTSDWWLAHVPPGRVPPWDFDAPQNAPRDSSAAAVAAMGLLDLAEHDTDPQRRQTYLAAGAATLGALLAAPYLAGPGNAAVLSHGTANLPAGSSDSGLVYGDYYLLLAMAQCGRLQACGGAAAAAGARVAPT